MIDRGCLFLFPVSLESPVFLFPIYIDTQSVANEEYIPKVVEFKFMVAVFKVNTMEFSIHQVCSFSLTLQAICSRGSLV